jgi:hypothetical protein
MPYLLDLYKEQKEFISLEQGQEVNELQKRKQNMTRYQIQETSPPKIVRKSPSLRPEERRMKILYRKMPQSN